MSAGVEHEAITDAERSSAMRARRSVRSALKTFRVTAKNPDEPVRYTQGQHVAVQEMLALQMFTIGRLVDRIERLEAKSVELRGVWRADETYKIGDLVSDRGGLWAATAESKNLRPGSAPVAWRLAVKRGAAG